MGKRITNVGWWREFNKGRIILILEPHEWKGSETEFVDMVNENGTIPKDSDKPTVNLRMKVRTKFGSEIMLKPGEFMMVEKKMIQDGKNN